MKDREIKQSCVELLSRDFKAINWAVKDDKQDNIKTDLKEITNIWSEYYQTFTELNCIVEKMQTEIDKMRT